jgi:tRNA(fMet)-specific endonuclease VapC
MNYTLDTNIISYLLKGNKSLSDKLNEKIKQGNSIIINLITYYEICRGLIAINNKDKLDKFIKICNIFGIAPITETTFYRAAEIYASLKQEGNLIDDADILIAAICLEQDFILITNNEKHFQRVKKIRIENLL